MHEQNNIEEQPLFERLLSVANQPLGVLIYGGATFLSALLIWTMIPQTVIELPFILLPLFVGFLLFARVWTIGLILLLFLVVALLNEPRVVSDSIPSEGIWFATSVLILVMSACRFYILTAPLVSVPRPRPKRRSWLFWRNWTPPNIASALKPRQSQHFQITELLTGFLRVLLPISIAMVLLWLTPLDPTSVSKYRLTPSGVRAISMSVSLFVVVMLTSGILGIFAWKRLSAAESRVYLRSVLTQFLQTDFRMVIKRKLKLRRSRLKG